MFDFLRRRPHATSRQVRRAPRRLLLEGLEERVIPTIPQPGSLLVPTFGAVIPETDPAVPDYTKSGVISVDPTTGCQTPISRGDSFDTPVSVTEGPDGKLY